MLKAVLPEARGLSTTYTIVEPNTYLVSTIGENMRDADALEIERWARRTPLEAALESWVRSERSWILMADDTPVTILGVGGLGVLTDEAIIWMLSHRDVERHWRYFLRESKPVLEAVLQHYPFVHNVVSVENRLTVRWLRWLGFEFSEKMVHNGTEFMAFWKGQRDV